MAVDGIARGLGARALRAVDRQALIDTLQRQSAAAQTKNLFDNAVMPSPPTITVGTVAAGLGQILPLQTSTAKFLNIGGAGMSFNQYYSQYSATVDAAFGNISAGKQQQQCAIEFMTDSDIVEVLLYTAGETKCRIAVGANAFDMQYATAGTTTLTAATNQYVKIDFGSRAARRVRFEVGTSGAYLDDVIIKSDAKMWKPADADFINSAWFGDSYFSSGQSGNWGHHNIAAISALKLGWRCTSASVAGTGYNTGVANPKFGDRLDDLLLQDFDVAVFCSGPNEPVSGSAAAAGLQAAALACWQGARQRLPLQPIVVLGAFPANSGPSAARIDIENKISAAFTEWADSNSVFIPVSTDANGTWISGTGRVGATNASGNSDYYTGTDSLHLYQPDGTFYSAARIANAIRDWLASA